MYAMTRRHWLGAGFVALLIAVGLSANPWSSEEPTAPAPVVERPTSDGGTSRALIRVSRPPADGDLPDVDKVPAARPAHERASSPLQATVDGPPRALSLDDLETPVFEALHDEVMALLQDIADECGGLTAEPLNAAAFVTLDDRGLLELALVAYDDGPELPEAFSDCMSDLLWDRPWMALPPNSELKLKVTMPLEGGTSEAGSDDADR